MREGRASRLEVAFALGLVYLFWGSTYLAIHYAIETLPPFSMAGARFLFAGTLLYAFARRRGGERPTGAHWRSASIVGGLLLFGGNGAVVWAQRSLPSSITALLITSTPLWMVLLDWWLRRARPKATVAAGLAIGALGIGILIGPIELSRGSEQVALIPALAVIVAALSWAMGSLYSQRAVMPSTPLLAAGMQMLSGGALLLAFGMARGEISGFQPASISAASLAGFFYLIVFGSLVGFTAYSWLLRNASISLISTYAYVNPVVAVVLGWAIAGEALTKRIFIAAPLVIGSVALITRFQSSKAS